MRCANARCVTRHCFSARSPGAAVAGARSASPSAAAASDAPARRRCRHVAMTSSEAPCFFVAAPNGQVVGRCASPAGSGRSGRRDPEHVALHQADRLHVRPDHQRRGSARSAHSLLCASLPDASDQQVPSLRVDFPAVEPSWSSLRRPTDSLLNPSVRPTDSGVFFEWMFNCRPLEFCFGLSKSLLRVDAS